MKSSTQTKSEFKKSSSAPNFSNPNNFNQKTKKPYVPKTSTPEAEGRVASRGLRPNSATGISTHKQTKSSSKLSTNTKIKTPKIILEFKNEEEKIKFTELKTKYPHICMPLTVKKIQSIQNIDGFDVLLTDEWIELQKEGWEFLKIMKPDQLEDPPESDDYRLEPLNNRWGDFVLFKKV